jgi:hypothetical protein
LTPIFDRLAASVTAMFVLVLLLVLLLAVFLEDVMLGALVAWLFAALVTSWWMVIRQPGHHSS